MEKGIKKTDVVGIVIKTVTILYVLLYTVMLLTPVIWGVLTSFKTRIDYRYNKFGLPKVWQFKNYITVMKNFEYEYKNVEAGYMQIFTFGNMMVNSFSYSLVGAFVTTVTTFCMAYASAKYDNFISKIIYGIVMLTLILPIYGGLAADIQLSQRLGTYNNFFGVVVIMKINFTGLHFLIMYGGIKSLPKTFSESAKIDGAGEFEVFLKIYLPLLSGLFFTIYILKFIDLWNDYQTPYIFLQSMPTAAYGLWLFKDDTSGEVAHVVYKLGGCMLVLIPALLLFILFANRLMNSVSLSGGIKE